MLRPIINPTVRIEKSTKWILKPVNSINATRVSNNRVKTMLRKISTELFTPGSTAFKMMSDTKPQDCFSPRDAPPDFDADCDSC